MEIYSDQTHSWKKVRNLLLDTGASISLLPISLGKTVMSEIKTGMEIPLGGIVPGKHLKAWIHTLRVQINGMALKVPMAIAEEEIVPILGRYNALDRMVVTFHKGKFLFLKK